MYFALFTIFQGTPASSGSAAAAPAAFRGAALRGRGGVRRGGVPGREPRRRARRAAGGVRHAHVRVRVRDAPVRRRAEGAGGARRAGGRGLPRLAHGRGARGRALLHAHAGLPHAPRQPAAHARARAPALRALPPRQRHRDTDAFRTNDRRQTGSSSDSTGDDGTYLFCRPSSLDSMCACRCARCRFWKRRS